MTHPDKDSVERFMHAPAGFMVAAKPDTEDHELCPLYVRASDYDALQARVDALEADRDAAIKERDEARLRQEDGWAQYRHWQGRYQRTKADLETALAAYGAAAAEAFNEGVEAALSVLRIEGMAGDDSDMAKVRALKRQPTNKTSESNK